MRTWQWATAVVAVGMLAGLAFATGLQGSSNYNMSGGGGSTGTTDSSGLNFTWGGVTFVDDGSGSDSHKNDNCFTSTAGYTVCFTIDEPGPPATWTYVYKDAQGNTLQTGNATRVP